MISITFRTDDGTRWGGGKGSNIEPEEIDRNFWDLKTAVEDLIANPPSPAQIASISIVGTAMTFQLTNGNVIGPLQLPVLSWRWRASWVPFSPFFALDVFSVEGVGIFLTLLDHTSDATFDPAALSDESQPLYKQIFGISTIAVPMTISAFLPGTQGASPRADIVVTDDAEFSANFEGSYVSGRVASTGTAIYSIKVNATVIGLATFTAAINEASLTTTDGLPQAFTAGDVIEIIGPVSPDATLADIRFGLRAILA
jgi:hypothetical protein